MKSLNRYQIFRAAVTVIAMGLGGARAAQTWNNGMANFSWDTTSTNWDAGAVWSNGNDAVFAGTGTGSINLAAGAISAHALTFNSNGYAIQGNPLTLTGTSPTITTATGVTASISSVITDGSVLTVAAASPAARQGTQNAACSEGGECVGYIVDGNWLRYDNVNFGVATTNVTVRVASATQGGQIELRLDSATGQMLGTVVVPNTGGWQTWTNINATIPPTSGLHTLVLKFLANPGASNLGSEYDKAVTQLAVVDQCIVAASSAQAARLEFLRCRLAAEKDHIELDARFSDTSWAEMPDVMQSWVRNFTHRVTDISSLGNVVSVENRFVQQNFLPRESGARAPVPVSAPLHPVVISPPTSVDAGQTAPLKVRVLDCQDNAQVAATLSWRVAGTEEWNQLPMTRVTKAVFTGEMPAAGLVEYFLTVTEGVQSVRWPAAGNRSFVTCD